MSKPTLCVIVPVYKAAATLDRCVASVLAQQVAGGLHCILVDDGSPDESGGLCDAWAARDPRVTVLHQENRGVSAARNAGLAAADGEYLVFLDADDALRPGALQAALDAQNTAPQSFVLWHYTTDELDTAAVTSDTATRPQNMLARLWLDCLLAMPWNKLYRTAPAQQLAFDRQYTLGEDLQFVLDYIDLLGRTAPDFAYTILTAPLTFYDCSREGTLSTKYHADYCKIWPEHFARLNKACYAAHCPQEDMRPLHRAELTVYAEGVADILRRDPAKRRAVRRTRLMPPCAAHGCTPFWSGCALRAATAPTTCPAAGAASALSGSWPRPGGPALPCSASWTGPDIICWAGGCAGIDVPYLSETACRCDAITAPCKLYTS